MSAIERVSDLPRSYQADFHNCYAAYKKSPHFGSETAAWKAAFTDIRRKYINAMRDAPEADQLPSESNQPAD